MEYENQCSICGEYERESLIRACCGGRLII